MDFVKYPPPQKKMKKNNLGNLLLYILLLNVFCPGDLVKKKMAESQQVQLQENHRQEQPEADADDFWAHFDREIAEECARHSGQNVAGG